MQHIPPGENSQKLLSRTDAVVGRPSCSGLYGIAFKDGEACQIRDLDGNKYLDCLTAASANILGYGNKDVVHAYAAQAQTMQHSGFLYSPNERAVELAEKIVTLTPGTFSKRVMFGLSGSDANDGAIEAMRRFTGRMELIHFKNAYHGTTGLSQPASNFGLLNGGIYPQSNLFHQVAFPHDEKTKKQTLLQIESLLKRGSVGGVIAEIIQGDAGIIIPAAGFFQELLSLLKTYNAIFIADEIQSGMGRTGKWWACEHEEIEPDILVTAKGLSAGYAPISIAIGREEIINAMDHGQQVMTYAGHAPSAAAALSVISVIEKDSLIEKNKVHGEALINALQNLKQKYPDIVSDVRGRGLMIGLEINSTLTKAGPLIATRCVEHGLYVGFFGVEQNVIRIEPPFTICKTDIDTIVNTLDRVLLEYRSHTIPDISYKNVLLYSSGL